MDANNNFAASGHSQQIKLMAEVLSKMATFFNDMAQQCLNHLARTDSQGKRQQITKREELGKRQQLGKREQLSKKEEVAINRDNPIISQHEKVVQKLEKIPKQTIKPAKKEYVLKKIKSHKPKHPVSSFFIFYKEKGQEIAKKKGEVLGSKIAKVVGQLWKLMPDSEKQPYEAKAKLARQRYQQEMIQYKIKYTDELARLKQLKRQARLRRKNYEEQKALMKPLVQEKVQKDEDSLNEAKDQNLNQLQDKEINEAEENQIQSSSDDSQLNLEDDLSDSLQSQAQDEFKTSNQPELHLQKAVIQPSQPREQPKTQQIQFKEEQHSSSNSIGNYQQSSSHQYHQALFHPIDFQNIPDLPQIPQPIEIPNPISPIHLQNNPIQPTIGNSQPKAEDQRQRPEELCSIADSDMKSEQQAPHQQQFIKPKGPVSSFFLFYRAKSKWISETKGLPLGPKAIKVASEIWKGLSQQEKNVYMQQARITRQQYYKDKQQLKKKYGQDIFQKTKGIKPAKLKPKK